MLCVISDKAHSGVYANYCRNSKAGRIISSLGIRGVFMKEVALPLGHERQAKCRCIDMTKDVGGRENGTNRMSLRWRTGKSEL